MKRNYFQIMSAMSAGILAVMMTGCAEKAGPEVTPSSLTFNLKVPEIERMTKVPGSSAENGTTFDLFAFYRFGEKDKYESVDIVSYAEMTPGEQNTLTYSMAVDANGRGAKKFVVLRAPEEKYFPKLENGNVMGNVLNAVTELPVEFVKTPMVMSSEDAKGNGYVTIEEISKLGNRVDVTLSRRLARIDFLNDEAASGIVLDKIFIKNARKRVYFGHVDLLPEEKLEGTITEIPVAELANGGKSIYLCPTVLSGDAESKDKTTIWATTKISGTTEDGPVLKLKAGEEVKIKANCLYELNTGDVKGSGSFDIVVKDWEDGTSVDWLPMEGGIKLQDANAVLVKGTQIQGNYVKIGAAATYPYIIKSVVTNSNPEPIEVTADGAFPSWLKVNSTVAIAGSGFYRHEIVYTVSKPKNNTLFAITYFKGSRDDKNILTIAFMDPYPGTPLPCLSWGDMYYGPTHVNQSTYLANNRKDKAFFAGERSYVLDSKESFNNDKAINPCPEGWSTLDDKQAEDLLKWVTTHVKSMDSDYVYASQWFGKAEEGTQVRFLAGYPRSGKNATWKDLACFGTWPHVTWAEMDTAKLAPKGGTYGADWSMKTGYAIAYRCIRPKAGWN